MRIPDRVVGQLQVPEYVHLPTGPDAAVAILVGREILDERFLRTGLVGGIGIGHVRVAADIESALRIGPAVEHQTVEVRVGDVVTELAELHSTRPRIRADLSAFELTYRVLRKRHPEADLIGAGGHVAHVRIVRVGDPERRCRVVGRNQDLIGVLAVASLLGRAGRGEVRLDARLRRMTLGLYPQVADELVAVLDAVLEEEAVTDGVVGHVVLDAQEIRAVHGHAAVVGVVDRGVLDVLALRVANQVPVDRIPRERQVLTHSGQLDARDIHLARRHRHDMAAEERLLGVGRCLDLDVARQQAHFAALVDVERDLAEVNVFEGPIERDRIAADGGNRAHLRLPRIVVRRRKDDLVTDSPAGGIQDLDSRAACLGRLGQLRPGVGPIAVQVQRAAGDHDAAVAHAGHGVLALGLVGEGERRIVCVGAVLAADGQLPVQNDPLGGQLEVGIVREGQLAVDRQTAQSRRADVEHDVHAFGNDHGIPCSGHFAIRPRGRIGPALLGPDFGDSTESKRWQRQRKKQTRSCRHGSVTSARANALVCLFERQNRVPFECQQLFTGPWLRILVLFDGGAGRCRSPVACSKGAAGGAETRPLRPDSTALGLVGRMNLARARTNALLFASKVQIILTSAGVDSMSGQHRSSLLASLLPTFLVVSAFTVLVPQEGRAQSADPSLWSDPATWPNGKVPVEGGKVVIARDKNVLLDVSPPALGGLSIDGKLAFSNDADLELTTEWIMLHGELAIGSEESPHTSNATITFTDNVEGEDVMAGMGDRGIMISDGTLNLHGDRTHAWTRLSAAAEAGSTAIEVLDASGWWAGDQIVLASTDYDPRQAEVRTIAATRGNTITLDEPLEYMYFGKITFDVDERG